MKFGFNPVSKASQTKSTRIKQKAKQRGEFSDKTKEAIFQRDNYRCVKCGSNKLEAVPHHIIFKSQGGTGHKSNGVTICLDCHKWAHGLKRGPNGELSKEGRYWFEEWAKVVLDQEGNYKYN